MEGDIVWGSANDTFRLVRLTLGSVTMHLIFTRWVVGSGAN